MADIKPIEIVRKGYRFRSKLEARWSVFFDALGIQWVYEPEGFQLPSGKWYEPDFKLSGFCGRGPDVSENCKRCDLWCEVKGIDDLDDMMDRKHDDYLKVREFSGFDIFFDSLDSLASDEELNIAFSKTNPIIILPNIPEDSLDWWNKDITNFDFVDGDFWSCIITKPDLFYNKDFVLCGSDGDSAPNDYEEYVTNEALKRARSVRFDHGENGEFEPIKIPSYLLKRNTIQDEDDFPF